MQKAICVRVKNVEGGFNLDELNDYLSRGYTFNASCYSTDNSLLIILDEPKKED